MTGREEVERKYRGWVEKQLKGSKKIIKNYAYFISDSTSVRTQNMYICIVRNFIDEIGTDFKHIGVDEIAEYIATRKNKHGELASQDYKQQVYSAIKGFFDYLVAKGEIKNNPMLKIARPKPSVYYEERTDFLTKEEIHIMIDNIKKRIKGNPDKIELWRDYAIIQLFLCTGIRVATLSELNVENIDLENNRMFVIGKGGKQKVYDLPENFEALKKWIRLRANDLYYFKCAALFPSRQSGRLSTVQINNIVKRYACGINKNITPHKLRATYATQVYKVTKDLILVQEIMGHSNVETTRRYIRGIENKTGEASSIMSSILNSTE